MNPLVGYCRDNPDVSNGMVRPLDRIRDIR
mgnify:CR=1 FL=1